jgi:hypothetical protein
LRQPRENNVSNFLWGKSRSPAPVQLMVYNRFNAQS